MLGHVDENPLKDTSDNKKGAGKCHRYSFVTAVELATKYRADAAQDEYQPNQRVHAGKSYPLRFRFLEQGLFLLVGLRAPFLFSTALRVL
jgi:hypothetical protein